MKRLLLSCLLLVMPFSLFCEPKNIEELNKKYAGEVLTEPVILLYKKKFFCTYDAGKQQFIKNKPQAADKETVGNTVKENNSAIVKSVKNNWKKVAGVSGLGLMAGSYYLYKSGKGVQVVEFAKPYATAGLKGLGSLSGQVKNGFNALVAAVKTKIGK